ncbi:MAG: helix-turn-helix domain-containing protein [Rhodobacteraceae bacterium]|nr:helix-turn-helix domain-containing protein [Paracoccaceae bacterium]
MTLERFESIRELPLFAEMTGVSFDALTRGAFVQNFPPNMVMISEGEAADFLHIVQSGCVELFSTWTNRETSVTTLYENSTFILAATMKDRVNLMSARTLQKSRIIMIPSENVRNVFATDPAFALAIVDELARCYRATIRNMKNLKLRTSIERLANYILKQHHRQGEALSYQLPVEKRRLASYLGMTPENLSRAFNNLKPHGVAVDGQTITISDKTKLTAFAKPDMLID